MKTVKTIFLMLFLFMGINLNAEQVGIMTTGANNQIFVVNGDSAIKVGTSSKDGDMFMTLPANVNKLTFYIAAWKDKPGTVIITDTTTTDTIAILDVVACPVISGSGKTFTIDSVKTYLDTLELTPQESELVLKFESGTARRFVVWNPEYVVEDAGETPTGINNINVNNNVTKYIDNNGRLYFRRGDDIYDVQGRLVK